ncbi:MAG: DUF1929 domain-containing protein [Pseudonocardia sp.]|nr:DUF1929 domain-containing protein [Pseudonocardia sp.]
MSRRQWGALTAMVAGALLVAPAGRVRADARSTGEWSPPFVWPVLPIHAVVLPDGRVMGYGAEADGSQTGAFSYAVWDPSRGDTAAAVTKLPNTTGADFFCSTQILVPATGDVLISGGDTTAMSGDMAGMHDMDESADGPASLSLNVGNQTSNVFDPGSDTVEQGPALNAKRWYATSTTLLDGRILLQGGADRNGGTGVATPEVYDPATGTWTSLTGIADADAYGTAERRWWYPHAFVAPNGRVLTILGSLIAEIDPAGAGSLTRVGTMPGANIGATSTAVMYRPGLILQVGGGGFFNGDDGPATAEATIVDVRSGTPVVTATAPMSVGRHWATATVLPSGEVLVTGGTLHDGDAATASTAPELWNPDTGTWRTLAAEQTPRLYHSVAALLPDGRVLSAAGGVPGPVLGLESQVFSPPYLFVEDAAARRPVVSDVPDTVAPGREFEIGVDAALGVSAVALVKTSSVTHSFNNEQRYVPLPFVQDGAAVTVTPPANAPDMPPGWYQLWVLDTAGVPSVAAIVEVPPG